MRYKIAIIVGSLRKESWNRKLANIIKEIAPDSLGMEFVDIANLPFYNEDLENPENVPQQWTAFREKMEKVDGVLFAVPEYNRSITAVLKNAIDVGSRPWGSSIWDGKVAAIISASIGAIGGFGANQILRQSLVTLNVICMQQPEAYISGAQNLFDENDNIQQDTKKFLHGFIDSYKKLLDKIKNI